jgi:hypothetical protein
MQVMANLAQPNDRNTDRPLRLPHVTPEFAALLEAEAARRGLPPDPWPLP